MKLFSRFFILLSVFSIVLGAGKDLPKSFMKCKRNDSKCFVAAAALAMKLIKPGLPEFGILPLDPLSIDSISITEGSDSPVSIRQELKNVKIYNITDSIITRYVGGFDKYRLQVTAVTPRMEIIGDYVLEGRVLVLPINGKGRANITIVDLIAEQELIGESYTKNDEVYFRLKEYKIKYTPKRVYMDFTNLFNGDKALSDNMNKFLNENWQIVFNEVKSGYEKSFGLIFKEICNKIFLTVPMNKLFLD